MAVSFSEPTAEVASTSTTNSLSFAAFTPTANSLLVLATLTTSSGTISISNTGTSLTWTSIVNTGFNASVANHILWAAVVPASVSSSVITLSASSNWTKAAMSILTATGGDLTARWRQASSNSSDSATSITATMGLSVLSTSGTIMFGARYESGGGSWSGTPTGYTLSANIAATDYRIGTWYRNSGQTGTTQTLELKRGSNVAGSLLYIEVPIAPSGRSFAPSIIG